MGLSRICAQLKQLNGGSGPTQKALGQRVNINPAQLSALLNGEVAWPPARVMPQWLRVVYGHSAWGGRSSGGMHIKALHPASPPKYRPARLSDGVQAGVADHVIRMS